MGIILDGQSKVTRRISARKLGDIFASAQKLDHSQGKVRETQRIRSFLLDEKLFQRF